MGLSIKFERLQIVMSDYGLGKFYHYTAKDGKTYPVIEMNRKMLEFDMELFCWVFQHELEHWGHYKKLDNWNKKDFSNELSQCWPTQYNIKMLTRLAKFEFKYPIDSHRKKFIFAQEMEANKW